MYQLDSVSDNLGVYSYGRFSCLFTALATSFLLFLFSLSSTSNASALYSASISASSNVSVDVAAVGTGIGINSDEVTVVTNCQAGYNLSLATGEDNNLYRNGDNTDTSFYISPINSTYALSDKTHNNNTWGISLANTPDTAGAFIPLSATPTIIKTTAETAVSSGTIEDVFPLYYGTSISNDALAGVYAMTNNDKITYYLTIDASCVDNIEVSFIANAGSDTVTNLPMSADNTISGNTTTLSTKTPSRSGYIFKEWNTAANGSGTYYYPGETLTAGQDGLAGFVNLYAIWVEECTAATICYDGNHADAGAMSDQTGTAGNQIVLIPSNFSRAGYGFAGWNTKADGTGTQYGPNQDFPMPSTGGAVLFARWIKPTGTLQSWTGASSMNVGDITALRDSRDNEVYTVAKLADNNVWIVENLRLVPNTSNITIYNTNNPTPDFLSNYPSSTTSGMCSTDDAECDNTVSFNTNNINRELTPSYNSNDSSSSWYSYGVMYNWYTATAGHGTFEKASGNVAGDLCPAGWHLPTGGSNGEWGIYSNAVGVTGDAGIRTYPNNFLRSGDYNASDGGGTGRGQQGRFWSATASNAKNAYRMGYNYASITATANSYGKWDGFNIRCIYQGGNIPYASIDVDFANAGIASVTFENNNYGTETATPSSPNVYLVEGATYTITASTASGYNFSSWSTTSGATLSSTTANPTTYAINGDATLTVTGIAIPSYEVTVNLGANVSSVGIYHADYGTQQVTASSGTVILYRGVEYTLSSSYVEGYTIDSWTTTANGSLGSSSTIATTYTITGAATLSISAKEAEEVTYTLIYDAGNGTDAPDTETATSYHSTKDFAITNYAPIYYGYTFTGWSETDGGTVDYTSGDIITVSSTGSSTVKTLYAVYQANSCPAGRICYYDNGADVVKGGRGTMNNQTTSSNASVNLIPSNYSKTGYGFAGWATDAVTTPYGPNANITTPNLADEGLALYAKWVKSTGDLQSWQGCSSMNTNDITALTDARDNQTYAVAKLADGKCWTIENLRLDPGNVTITALNTHNPTATFITETASATSLNTLCNDNGLDTCYNQIQYNSNSLKRSLTPSYNTDSPAVTWFSYGVYYNWYTATAGNGTYSTANNTTVSGDICPINWHLPSGNNNGEFNALNTAVNSGATNRDTGLRAFPVNFVWSGDYNNAKRNSSYSNGRLWTATAKNSSETYRAGYASNNATLKNNVYYKWDGFAVRCVKD